MNSYRYCFSINKTAKLMKAHTDHNLTAEKINKMKAFFIRIRIRVYTLKELASLNKTEN